MKLIYSHQDINEVHNKNIITHSQNNIELIKIISGKMEALINGKEYLLEKDDICIINKDQLHRIYCTNDLGKECDYILLYIEKDIFTSNKEIYDKYISSIMDDKSFTHIISKGKDSFNKDISIYLSNIDQLEINKPEAYELNVIAYLHMLIRKLYLKYKELNLNNESNISFDLFSYRKISEYIVNNYMNKITLEDLSNIAHISKNKICELFKEYTMSSFVDYLNSYRLEKAIYLLEKSDESMSNIAYRCGFNEQSYFNKIFLKYYEMTPKEYRKIFQNK